MRSLSLAPSRGRRDSLLDGGREVGGQFVFIQLGVSRGVAPSRCRPHPWAAPFRSSRDSRPVQLSLRSDAMAWRSAAMLAAIGIGADSLRPTIEALPVPGRDVSGAIELALASYACWLFGGPEDV